MMTVDWSHGIPGEEDKRKTLKHVALRHGKCREEDELLPG